LERGLRINASNLRQRVARLAGALETLGPRATLARGYAIVRRLPDREVVHAAREAEPGTRVEAILHEGSLRCVVEDIC
jgi:exodeoxyribonuclease VII large subunit